MDGSPRSTIRSNGHGRRRSNVLCRNKEQRGKQDREPPPFFSTADFRSAARLFGGGRVVTTEPWTEVRGRTALLCRVGAPPHRPAGEHSDFSVSTPDSMTLFLSSPPYFESIDEERSPERRARGASRQGRAVHHVRKTETGLVAASRR